MIQQLYHSLLHLYHMLQRVIQYTCRMLQQCYKTLLNALQINQIQRYIMLQKLYHCHKNLSLLHE